MNDLIIAPNGSGWSAIILPIRTIAGSCRSLARLGSVRFWLSAAKRLGALRTSRACRVGQRGRVCLAHGLPPGGQTITSNPEGKPDHVRPGRGTHPAGTGLQPTTVHAICGRGCALALRRGCDLALTAVETRAAIMAMMSDLIIGSASATSKISRSPPKTDCRREACESPVRARSTTLHGQTE